MTSRFLTCLQGPERVFCPVMDEIKRKLELIDRQVTRRRFHERAVSTCPLAFVAIGLCAGIILQSTLGVPVSGWLALIGLCAVAAVLFFTVAQLYHTNIKYVTAYLALICFACLGAIRLADYGRPKPNDIRNYVGDQRTLGTIRGLVATEPRINRYPDWRFAKFRHADPSTGFYLKLDQAKTAEGWRPAQGIIRAYVDEPVLDLQCGDKIQAYCWLDRFGPPTNPGQFDTAAYLARRNVYVGASIKSRAAIEVISSRSAGILAKLRAKIRNVAARALLGDADTQEPGHGLLQALLLGERRKIDRNTYLAFRKTGLLHFISLSGMHLGILIWLVWRVSGTAGLMKPARGIICAIAVVLFLLVVPPRAPTVRAAVIAWVFCASIFFRRHPNSLNTLSLAAIILLLIRPTQLFEAGWQLSFASVLGIILLTEQIEILIFGEDQVVRQPTGILRVIPDPRSLFAIGLAAWVGGAGVLLYHFHTINPFTSIWTVLVFPLVFAILVLGFLKMLLFFLLPTLSGLLGVAVGLLSDALVWVVGIIAKLDISEILIGQVSFVPVLGYYCVVVFVGYARFRRPLPKRLICTAILLPLVAYPGVLKYKRTYPENLIVTCLDVGHGQAILTQLPGGKNILFDAGSLHNSDIGARIVAPFLDYKGIGKIDAIVVSHNDTDHINGIPEIMESRKVGCVYDANDPFFDKADPWGTAACLKECLADHDLEIAPLGSDIRSGDAVIKKLWPPEELVNAGDLSDNDRSLVSLIEYAGVKVLLCSDIEQFAQKQLLRMYPSLHADVIVVPHHGSTNTLDPTFLESLNAGILICSCDRTQYERSAAGTGRGCRLADRAENFYTSRDGAVVVTVNDNGAIKADPFVK